MRADLGHWLHWWNAVRARGDGAGVHARLCLAYAEKPRRYHTLEHIAACLQRFDDLRDLCRDPHAVEMAIWFHDAVYAPRRADNEARSAAWALQVAADAGLDAAFGAAVARLIEATSHATTPDGDPDLAVLIDADLAILAANADAFAAYEAGVRSEYEWVPAEHFRERRIAILEGFLARPAIFSTKRMREACEAPARQNLIRSIARLRAGVGG